MKRFVILLLLIFVGIYAFSACDVGGNGGDTGTGDTAFGTESNAPSDETTAPSDETTAPTDETTAPTDETTAPPEETTAPPEETTAPSDETTAPSDETTAPPAETTAPPAETTAPPDDQPDPEDGYPLPTVMFKNSVYQMNYPAIVPAGAITTFQTQLTYSDEYNLPSDAVMAYVSNIAGMDGVFRRWMDVSDRYRIDMMMALNRDNNEYLPRNPSVNIKDVQTNSSGGLMHHGSPTSSNYYMVPTLDWIEYVWEVTERAVRKFDPKTIVFEEPEMWHSSGYSQGFKDEWKLYYGENWEDQNSSPEAMFKTMRLKTYLFERILTEISERVKGISPDTKIYIATHSTVNYSAWGITAGLNSYLALGVIDGIIGQTWSDTANSGIPYGGRTIQDPYLCGILEYSSYLDSVEGMDFFALSDPMADNASYTEEDCQYLYRQTLVASLMNPEISRFQLFPWPSRSYVGVSATYQTIQLQIFSAMRRMSGKQVTLTAGTPGVTFAVSDSLSWQAGASTWGPTAANSFFGINLPLATDGLQVKMKSLEHILTADDLNGVTVLLLTYDSQKPLSEKVNIAIADWVRKGGVVLYLGGYDSFTDSDAEWWSDKGGSPLENLFGHLGLDSVNTSKVTNKSSSVMSWTGSGTGTGINTVSLLPYSSGSHIYFTGSDNAIITAGGKTIGIDEKVGNGHFIAVGINSGYYASRSTAPGIVRAMTEYALQYTDYDYVKTNLMTVRRGDVLSAHAISKSATLEGKYINLFDPLLSIEKDVKVTSDDSVMLLDISGLDLSVPRLAFTGGLISGDVKETAGSTEFAFTGPANSTVSTRFIAPEGKYPESITATRKGIKQGVTSAWSNDDNSLLIYVPAGADNTTVKVTWGSTPVADSSIPIFTELVVRTTAANEDADFIFSNTAYANDGLRYCDLSGELVYKFDLAVYKRATVDLSVFQNYIVEYSTDNKNYKVIADYSEEHPEHLTDGSNSTVISVSTEALGITDGSLYIRIRNTDTTMGWGGSITSFRLRYMK